MDSDTGQSSDQKNKELPRSNATFASFQEKFVVEDNKNQAVADLLEDYDKKHSSTSTDLNAPDGNSFRVINFDGFIGNIIRSSDHVENVNKHFNEPSQPLKATTDANQCSRKDKLVTVPCKESEAEKLSDVNKVWCLDKNVSSISMKAATAEKDEKLSSDNVLLDTKISNGQIENRESSTTNTAFAKNNCSDIKYHLTAQERPVSKATILENSDKSTYDTMNAASIMPRHYEIQPDESVPAFATNSKKVHVTLTLNEKTSCVSAYNRKPAHVVRQLYGRDRDGKGCSDDLTTEVKKNMNRDGKGKFSPSMDMKDLGSFSSPFNEDFKSKNQNSVPSESISSPDESQMSTKSDKNTKLSSNRADKVKHQIQTFVSIACVGSKEKKPKALVSAGDEALRFNIEGRNSQDLISPNDIPENKSDCSIKPPHIDYSTNHSTLVHGKSECSTSKRLMPASSTTASKCRDINFVQSNSKQLKWDAYKTWVKAGPEDRDRAKRLISSFLRRPTSHMKTKVTTTEHTETSGTGNQLPNSRAKSRLLERSLYSRLSYRNYNSAERGHSTLHYRCHPILLSTDPFLVNGIDLSTAYQSGNSSSSDRSIESDISTSESDGEDAFVLKHKDTDKEADPDYVPSMRNRRRKKLKKDKDKNLSSDVKDAAVVKSKGLSGNIALVNRKRKFVAEFKCDYCSLNFTAVEDCIIHEESHESILKLIPTRNRYKGSPLALSTTPMSDILRNSSLSKPNNEDAREMATKSSQLIFSSYTTKENSSYRMNNQSTIDNTSQAKVDSAVLRSFSKLPKIDEKSVRGESGHQITFHAFLMKNLSSKYFSKGGWYCLHCKILVFKSESEGLESFSAMKSASEHFKICHESPAYVKKMSTILWSRHLSTPKSDSNANATASNKKSTGFFGFEKSKNGDSTLSSTQISHLTNPHVTASRSLFDGRKSINGESAEDIELRKKEPIHANASLSIPTKVDKRGEQFVAKDGSGSNCQNIKVTHVDNVPDALTCKILSTPGGTVEGNKCSAAIKSSVHPTPADPIMNSNGFCSNGITEHELPDNDKTIGQRQEQQERMKCGERMEVIPTNDIPPVSYMQPSNYVQPSNLQVCSRCAILPLCFRAKGSIAVSSEDTFEDHLLICNRESPDISNLVDAMVNMTKGIAGMTFNTLTGDKFKAVVREMVGGIEDFVTLFTDCVRDRWFNKDASNSQIRLPKVNISADKWQKFPAKEINKESVISTMADFARSGIGFDFVVDTSFLTYVAIIAPGFIVPSVQDLIECW